MGIKIEINTEPHSGKPPAQQIDEAFAALGFVRSTPRPVSGSGIKVDFSAAVATEETKAAEYVWRAMDEVVDGFASQTEEVVPTAYIPTTGFAPPSIDESIPEASGSVGRVHGQPSPGAKRRTKIEMAEDRAYFGTEDGNPPQTAAAPAPEAAPTSLFPDGDPTPEQLAAAAQDAADEAAERKEGLTRDDLRAAVARFSKVHGLVEAQKQVPALIGCSIMEVPETPEALTAAIAALDLATHAPSPLVEAKAPEPVQATKGDVIEAFKAYGRKYDGTDTDLSKAVFTQKDGPALLTTTFGKGVTSIATIPADPVSYGKALSAINDAIRDNPFGRKVLA